MAWNLVFSHSPFVKIRLHIVEVVSLLVLAPFHVDVAWLSMSGLSKYPNIPLLMPSYMKRGMGVMSY